MLIYFIYSSFFLTRRSCYSPRLVLEINICWGIWFCRKDAKGHLLKLPPIKMFFIDVYCTIEPRCVLFWTGHNYLWACVPATKEPSAWRYRKLSQIRTFGSSQYAPFSATCPCLCAGPDAGRIHFRARLQTSYGDDKNPSGLIKCKRCKKKKWKRKKKKNKK